MSDDEWIVRVQGKEYGPVDLETLRDWQRDGRLIPENEVRKSSDTFWARAETVQDLFSQSAPAGPPPLPQFRRRSVGEILIETIRIYRTGFASFFGLALLVAVPSFLLKICLAGVNISDRRLIGAPAIIAGAAAVVLTAIILAIWPIFVAGIQIMTAEVAAGRSVALRDVLRRAVRFWLKVAKLSLLVYGSYFVWSAIPLLAILSLIAGEPSIATFLLALGILVLQVYMTARLFVNFLFWQQASVLGELNTLEALRESKELARIRPEAPWTERPLYRGAFLASIWFLLLLVFSVGAELPFLLVRLQGITNPQDALAFLQKLAHTPAVDAITIATYAVTSLVHAALRPLLGIAFVVLYFHTKG